MIEKTVNENDIQNHQSQIFISLYLAVVLLSLTEEWSVHCLQRLSIFRRVSKFALKLGSQWYKETLVSRFSLRQSIDKIVSIQNHVCNNYGWIHVLKKVSESFNVSNKRWINKQKKSLVSSHKVKTPWNVWPSEPVLPKKLLTIIFWDGWTIWYLSTNWSEKCFW